MKGEQRVRVRRSNMHGLGLKRVRVRVGQNVWVRVRVGNENSE